MSHQKGGTTKRLLSKAEDVTKRNEEQIEKRRKARAVRQADRQDIIDELDQSLDTFRVDLDKPTASGFRSNLTKIEKSLSAPVRRMDTVTSGMQLALAVDVPPDIFTEGEDPQTNFSSTSPKNTQSQRKLSNASTNTSSLWSLNFKTVQAFKSPRHSKNQSGNGKEWDPLPESMSSGGIEEAQIRANVMREIDEKWSEVVKKLKQEVLLLTSDKRKLNKSMAMNQLWLNFVNDKMKFYKEKHDILEEQVADLLQKGNTQDDVAQAELEFYRNERNHLYQKALANGESMNQGSLLSFIQRNDDLKQREASLKEPIFLKMQAGAVYHDLSKSQRHVISVATRNLDLQNHLRHMEETLMQQHDEESESVRNPQLTPWESQLVEQEEKLNRSEIPSNKSNANMSPLPMFTSPKKVMEVKEQVLFPTLNWAQRYPVNLTNAQAKALYLSWEVAKMPKSGKICTIMSDFITAALSCMCGLEAKAVSFFGMISKYLSNDSQKQQEALKMIAQEQAFMPKYRSYLLQGFNQLLPTMAIYLAEHRLPAEPVSPTLRNTTSVESSKKKADAHVQCEILRHGTKVKDADKGVDQLYLSQYLETEEELVRLKKANEALEQKLTEKQEEADLIMEKLRSTSLALQESHKGIAAYVNMTASTINLPPAVRNSMLIAEKKTSSLQSPRLRTRDLIESATGLVEMMQTDVQILNQVAMHTNQEYSDLKCSLTETTMQKDQAEHAKKILMNIGKHDKPPLGPGAHSGHDSPDSSVGQLKKKASSLRKKSRKSSYIEDDDRSEHSLNSSRQTGIAEALNNSLIEASNDIHVVGLEPDELSKYQYAMEPILTDNGQMIMEPRLQIRYAKKGEISQLFKRIMVLNDKTQIRMHQLKRGYDRFLSGLEYTEEADICVVFGNIDGGKHLWEVFRAQMAEVQPKIKEKVQMLLRLYHGKLLQEVDGNFMASFPAPIAGLRFCCALQQGLLTMDWPKEILDHSLAAIEQKAKVLKYRGLRMSIAMDWGPCKGVKNTSASWESCYGPAAIRALKGVSLTPGGTVAVLENAYTAMSDSDMSNYPMVSAGFIVDDENTMPNQECLAHVVRFAAPLELKTRLPADAVMDDRAIEFDCPIDETPFSVFDVSDIIGQKAAELNALIESSRHHVKKLKFDATNGYKIFKTFSERFAKLPDFSQSTAEYAVDESLAAQDRFFHEESFVTTMIEDKNFEFAGTPTVATPSSPTADNVDPFLMVSVNESEVRQEIGSSFDDNDLPRQNPDTIMARGIGQVEEAYGIIASQVETYLENEHSAVATKIQHLRDSVAEPALDLLPAGCPSKDAVITVVFVDATHYHWEDKEPMSSASLLYNTLIDHQVKDCQGYGFKKTAGGHFIVFPSPQRAFQFCCRVQKMLPKSNWSPELLEMEGCSEVKDDDGKTIFAGIRCRMGMAMGAPSDYYQIYNAEDQTVDYCGHVVNAAGGICARAPIGCIYMCKGVHNALQRDNDMAPCEIADMGKFNLAGVSGPQEVVSVIPQELRGRWKVVHATADIAKETEETKDEIDIPLVVRSKVSNWKKLKLVMKATKAFSGLSIADAPLHLAEGLKDVKIKSLPLEEKVIGSLGHWWVGSELSKADFKRGELQRVQKQIGEWKNHRIVDARAATSRMYSLRQEALTPNPLPYSFTRTTKLTKIKDKDTYSQESPASGTNAHRLKGVDNEAQTDPIDFANPTDPIDFANPALSSGNSAASEEEEGQLETKPHSVSEDSKDSNSPPQQTETLEMLEAPTDIGDGTVPEFFATITRIRDVLDQKLHQMNKKEHIISQIGLLDTCTVVLLEIADLECLHPDEGELDKIVTSHILMVRNLIANTDGFEVLRKEDCFLVVFELAANALTFATKLQYEYLRHKWPLLRSATGKAIVPTVKISLCTGSDYKESVDAQTGVVNFDGPLVDQCIQIQGHAPGGVICLEEQSIQSLKTDGMLDKYVLAPFPSEGTNVEKEWGVQVTLPVELEDGLIQSMAKSSGLSKATQLRQTTVGPQGMIFLISGTAEVSSADTSSTTPLIYRTALKSLIQQFRAYEVSQSGFSFTIAFSAKEPNNALQFCLVIQDVMRQQDWAASAKNQDPDKGFNGPRLRLSMGLGLPMTSVDDATGRTTYAGQFVSNVSTVLQVIPEGQIWFNSQAHADLEKDLWSRNWIVREKGPQLFADVAAPWKTIDEEYFSVMPDQYSGRLKHGPGASKILARKLTSTQATTGPSAAAALDHMSKKLKIESVLKKMEDVQKYLPYIQAYAKVGREVEADFQSILGRSHKEYTDQTISTGMMTETKTEPDTVALPRLEAQFDKITRGLQVSKALATLYQECTESESIYGMDGERILVYAEVADFESVVTFLTRYGQTSDVGVAQEVLRMFCAIVNTLITYHHGRKIVHAGQACIVEFQDAQQAFDYANAIHLTLLKTQWSGGAVKLAPWQKRRDKYGKIIFCGPSAKVVIHIGHISVKIDPQPKKHPKFGGDGLALLMCLAGLANSGVTLIDRATIDSKAMRSLAIDTKFQGTFTIPIGGKDSVDVFSVLILNLEGRVDFGPFINSRPIPLASVFYTTCYVGASPDMWSDCLSHISSQTIVLQDLIALSQNAHPEDLAGIQSAVMKFPYELVGIAIDLCNESKPLAKLCYDIANAGRVTVTGKHSVPIFVEDVGCQTQNQESNDLASVAMKAAQNEIGYHRHLTTMGRKLKEVRATLKRKGMKQSPTASSAKGRVVRVAQSVARVGQDSRLLARLRSPKAASRTPKSAKTPPVAETLGVLNPINFDPSEGSEDERRVKFDLLQNEGTDTQSEYSNVASDDSEERSRISSYTEEGLEEHLTVVPTGEVTIACTSISGSKELWSQFPQAMVTAMKIYRKWLRFLEGECGGYQFSHVGDNFLVAFESASQALEFGAKLQEVMNNEEWPPELLVARQCEPIKIKKKKDFVISGLRVQIGIEEGYPSHSIEQTTGRVIYSGETVMMAAQFAATGRGGMIYLGNNVYKSLETTAAINKCAVRREGVYQSAEGETLDYFCAVPESLAQRFVVFPSKHGVESRTKSVLGKVLHLTNATSAMISLLEKRDQDMKFKGEAAIVFAIIEDYDGLKQDLPDSLKIATSGYLTALSVMAEQYHGWSSNSEPDQSWAYAAFTDLENAVSFVADLQMALIESVWPKAILDHSRYAKKEVIEKKTIFKGLRIKMGLCLGLLAKSKDASGKLEYTGSSVQRAAQLAHLAPGGILFMDLESHRNLKQTRVADKVHSTWVADVDMTDQSGISRVEIYGLTPLPVQERMELCDVTNVQPSRNIEVQYNIPSALTRKIGTNMKVPTGEVSIVAMDVFGYNRLKSAYPDVIQDALKIYHTVVMQWLSEHDGGVVVQQDDSMLAVFDDIHSAAMFSCQVQEELMKQPWPATMLSDPHMFAVKDPLTGEALFKGMRARMALHIGPVRCHITQGTAFCTGRNVEFTLSLFAHSVPGAVSLSHAAQQRLKAEDGLEEYHCVKTDSVKIATQDWPIVVHHLYPKSLAARADNAQEMMPLEQETRLATSYKQSSKMSRSLVSDQSSHTAPKAGDLSVVVTSIEGYYRMREEAREDLDIAVDIYHCTLQDLVIAHGGYRAHTNDDMVTIIFATPVDAALFCFETQSKFMRLAWPKGLSKLPGAEDVRLADGQVVLKGLRVRIGTSTGICRRQYNRGTHVYEYFGDTIYKSAYMSTHVAIGGVSIVSERMLLRLIKEYPVKFSWVSLGFMELCGAGHEEEVFCIQPSSLDARMKMLDMDFPREKKSYDDDILQKYREPSHMNIESLQTGPDAPTLTLCLIDIQGTEHLQANYPQEMGAALLIADNLLRGLVAQTKGYEVKTLGDAWFLVFESPHAAATTCCVAQQAFLKTAWPTGILEDPNAQEEMVNDLLLFYGLRMRMAFDHGPVRTTINSATGRNDYHGQVVHQVGGMLHRTPGGYIYLGREAYLALTLQGTRESVQFLSLGQCRLKGIEEEQQIYSMQPTSLADRLLTEVGTKLGSYELEYDQRTQKVLVEGTAPVKQRLDFFASHIEETMDKGSQMRLKRSSVVLAKEDVVYSENSVEALNHMALNLEHAILYAQKLAESTNEVDRIEREAAIEAETQDHSDGVKMSLSSLSFNLVLKEIASQTDAINDYQYPNKELISVETDTHSLNDYDSDSELSEFEPLSGTGNGTPALRVTRSFALPRKKTLDISIQSQDSTVPFNSSGGNQGSLSERTLSKHGSLKGLKGAFTFKKKALEKTKKVLGFKQNATRLVDSSKKMSKRIAREQLMTKTYWGMTISLARKGLIPNPVETGKLAVVVFDIDGITEWWMRYPDLMESTVSCHNTLARSLIEKYDGLVARNFGDAFMATFKDPLQALKFCGAFHEELKQFEFDFSVQERQKMLKDHLLIPSLASRMSASFGEVHEKEYENFKRTTGPGALRAIFLHNFAKRHHVALDDRLFDMFTLANALHDWSAETIGTHRIRGADTEVYQLLHNSLSSLMLMEASDAELSQNKEKDELPPSRLPAQLDYAAEDVTFWGERTEQLEQLMSKIQSYQQDFMKIPDRLADLQAIESATRSLMVGNNDMDNALDEVESGVIFSDQMCQTDPVEFASSNQYLGHSIPSLSTQEGESLRPRSGRSSPRSPRSPKSPKPSSKKKSAEMQKKSIVSLQTKLASLTETAKQLQEELGLQKTQYENQVAEYEKQRLLSNENLGPKGRLTFVFTDIEGAGRLWADENMAQASEIYEQVLTNLAEKHMGYFVKSLGDAHFIVFTQPEDAVQFACTLQKDMLQHEGWPPGILRSDLCAEELDEDGALRFKGLRVRIGMTTGEAKRGEDYATGKSDYWGEAVSHALTLTSYCKGGFVCIGDSTYKDVESTNDSHRILDEYTVQAENPPSDADWHGPSQLFSVYCKETLNRKSCISRVGSNAAVHEGMVDLVGRDRASTTKGPRGNVAFVYCETADSDELWDRHYATMKSCVAITSAITKRLAIQFDGHEFQNIRGDSLLVAFETVQEALQYAVAAQMALPKQAWPGGCASIPQVCELKDEKNNLLFDGLRVRMGIGFGRVVTEEDAETGKYDYFGEVVIKTIKLGHMSDPGIISISEAAVSEFLRSHPDGLEEYATMRSEMPNTENSFETITRLAPKSLEARFDYYLSEAPGSSTKPETPVTVGEETKMEKQLNGRTRMSEILARQKAKVDILSVFFSKFSQGFEQIGDIVVEEEAKSETLQATFNSTEVSTLSPLMPHKMGWPTRELQEEPREDFGDLHSQVETNQKRVARNGSAGPLGMKGPAIPKETPSPKGSPPQSPKGQQRGSVSSQKKSRSQRSSDTTTIVSPHTPRRELTREWSQESLISSASSGPPTRSSSFIGSRPEVKVQPRKGEIRELGKVPTRLLLSKNKSEAQRDVQNAIMVHQAIQTELPEGTRECPRCQIQAASQLQGEKTDLTMMSREDSEHSLKLQSTIPTASGAPRPYRSPLKHPSSRIQSPMLPRSQHAFRSRSSSISSNTFRCRPESSIMHLAMKQRLGNSSMGASLSDPLAITPTKGTLMSTSRKDLSTPTPIVGIPLHLQASRRGNRPGNHVRDQVADIKDLDMLAKINAPKFNIWPELSKMVLHGGPLYQMAMNVFQFYSFFDRLGVNKRAFGCFLYRVQKAYADNPYHNATHAADVLQNTHHLLQATGLHQRLTDIQIFACLLAAVMIDCSHPGVSNDYLIAKLDPMAVLYSDISVLEMHHLAVCWRIFFSHEDSNFLEKMDNQMFSELRSYVIDLVTYSDFKFHPIIIEDLGQEVAGGDIVLLMKALFHLADICKPCKAWNIYEPWGQRLMREFYRQGTKERRDGSEPSPFCDPSCDRNLNFVACQLGIIENVVRPFVFAISEVLPNLTNLLETLDINEAKLRSTYDTQVGNGARRNWHRLVGKVFNPEAKHLNKVNSNAGENMSRGDARVRLQWASGQDLELTRFGPEGGSIGAELARLESFGAEEYFAPTKEQYEWEPSINIHGIDMGEFMVSSLYATGPAGRHKERLRRWAATPIAKIPKDIMQICGKAMFLGKPRPHLWGLFLGDQFGSGKVVAVEVDDEDNEFPSPNGILPRVCLTLKKESPHLIQNLLATSTKGYSPHGGNFVLYLRFAEDKDADECKAIMDGAVIKPTPKAEVLLHASLITDQQWTMLPHNEALSRNLFANQGLIVLKGKQAKITAALAAVIEQYVDYITLSVTAARDVILLQLKDADSASLTMELLDGHTNSAGDVLSAHYAPDCTLVLDTGHFLERSVKESEYRSIIDEIFDTYAEEGLKPPHVIEPKVTTITVDGGGTLVRLGAVGLYFSAEDTYDAAMILNGRKYGDGILTAFVSSHVYKPNIRLDDDEPTTPPHGRPPRKKKRSKTQVVMDTQALAYLQEILGVKGVGSRPASGSYERDPNRPLSHLPSSPRSKILDHINLEQVLGIQKLKLPRLIDAATIMIGDSIISIPQDEGKALWDIGKERAKLNIQKMRYEAAKRAEARRRATVGFTGEDTIMERDVAAAKRWNEKREEVLKRKLQIYLKIYKLATDDAVEKSPPLTPPMFQSRGGTPPSPLRPIVSRGTKSPPDSISIIAKGVIPGPILSGTKARSQSPDTTLQAKSTETAKEDVPLNFASYATLPSLKSSSGPSTESMVSQKSKGSALSQTTLPTQIRYDTQTPEGPKPRAPRPKLPRLPASRDNRRLEQAHPEVTEFQNNVKRESQRPKRSEKALLEGYHQPFGL